MLLRGSEYCGVVVNYPRVSKAISQVLHHQPEGVMPSIGIVAINATIRIDGNASMPCEE